MANEDTGAGATIVLGTTGGVGNARLISGHTVEIGSVDLNSLGLSGNMQSIPGDLANPGEFDVEYEFDNTQATVPAPGTVETVTIVHPAGTFDITGTGFIRAVKYPDLQNEELNVLKLTIKWDGKTGPLYAAV